MHEVVVDDDLQDQYLIVLNFLKEKESFRKWSLKSKEETSPLVSELSSS